MRHLGSILGIDRLTSGQKALIVGAWALAAAISFSFTEGPGSAIFVVTYLAVFCGIVLAADMIWARSGRGRGFANNRLPRSRA